MTARYVSIAVVPPHARPDEGRQRNPRGSEACWAYRLASASSPSEAGACQHSTHQSAHVKGRLSPAAGGAPSGPLAGRIVGLSRWGRLLSGPGLRSRRRRCGIGSVAVGTRPRTRSAPARPEVLSSKLGAVGHIADLARLSIDQRRHPLKLARIALVMHRGAASWPTEIRSVARSLT